MHLLKNKYNFVLSALNGWAVIVSLNILTFGFGSTVKQGIGMLKDENIEENP